ncbi:MAG: N-acetylmuramoyl-L-alanine amidase [Rhodospirillales bacterium]
MSTRIHHRTMEIGGKIRRYAMIFSALCLAFLTAGQARAADAVVTDLQSGFNGDGARFVLHLDRRVAFRLFTLSNPYRVVIDLPEVGWQLPARPLPGKQGVFSGLRYGLFRPGNSRIVFEFQHPIQVADAYVTPGGGRAAYELVIDAQRTSLETFTASVAMPPREIAGLRPRGAAKPPATVATSSRLESIAQRTAALAAPGAGAAESRATPAAGQILASNYLPMPPRRPGGRPSAHRPLIIIDPGHGGVDPGAQSRHGIYEKHVVLALSREITRQLTASGRYRAEMTRDRDVFIRLRDRVAIARKKGADIFISVHADSIRNSKVSGPSVYTLSEKASDKEAAELAERENKADLIAGMDLSHESADVANILIDLAQRESMNQSARFAGYLVSELGNKTEVLPRPHRFAGFAVLKAPDLPSVLLETGFLSNRDDERRLTSKSYRRQLASAIVAAIDHYFGAVEQAKVRMP